MFRKIGLWSEADKSGIAAVARDGSGTGLYPLVLLRGLEYRGSLSTRRGARSGCGGSIPLQCKTCWRNRTSIADHDHRRGKNRDSWKRHAESLTFSNSGTAPMMFREFVGMVSQHVTCPLGESSEFLNQDRVT